MNLIDRDALVSRLEKAIKCKPYLESGLNAAISLVLTAPVKEQEPVSPIRMHHTEHKQTDNYRCGKCGDDMYFEQRFCGSCGQAAKWD